MLERVRSWLEVHWRVGFWVFVLTSPYLVRPPRAYQGDVQDTDWGLRLRCAYGKLLRNRSAIGSEGEESRLPGGKMAA